MNVFYEISYGKNAFIFQCSDVLLHELNKVDFVDKQLFTARFSGDSSFNTVFQFLQESGYVAADERALFITTSGKLFIGNGGFKGKAILTIVKAVSSVIGVCGAVSAIITLLLHFNH